MLRQTLRLLKLSNKNAFGINEFRFTTDPKRRRRFLLLAVAYAIVAVLLLSYDVLLCLGFAQLGMAARVPEIIFAAGSLIILVFSVFKAGAVLYNLRGYDMLASLPMPRAAIALSRFMKLYLSNLLISLAFMLPAAVIYVMYEGAALGSIAGIILGVIFMPMLPLAAACALGAAITAVSSRMRQKNLVSSLLTVIVIVAVFALPSLASRAGFGDLTQLTALSALFEGLIRSVESSWPPAVWFHRAAVGGEAMQLLVLAGVSLGVFAAVIILVSRKFGAVCSALNGVSARNNYSHVALSSASPVRALFKRELRRYFASSVYVTNTAVGYILMVIFSAALLLAGPEIIENELGMEGIATKVLPFILAILGALTSTTSCSVSMEGSRLWIAQTLPVRARDIYLSKILVNLAVAAPFYLVSAVLCFFAVRPTPVEAIYLAVIPAVYILFSAVAGIAINLALPVLDRDTEVRVVKQSASTLVSMLVGLVCAAIPTACILAFNFDANIVFPAAITVILILTVAVALTYMRNSVVYRP